MLNNENINSFKNNSSKSEIEKNNITEGKENDYSNNINNVYINNNDEIAPPPVYDPNFKNMNTDEK